MENYITPDMAVYEGTLIKQYEAYAASVISCVSGAVACSSGAVSCTTLAVGTVSCTANEVGCGHATFCSSKSST